MEFERGVLVSPSGEVPVVDGEVVTAIRALAGRGVGKKAIAREVGVAVNTVRRYLREPIPAGHQVRPGARRLTDVRRAEVRALYEGPAGSNAVVAQRLLAAQGLTVSVRTIERAVADLRRARRAAQLATVRVETPPGDQLQSLADQRLHGTTRETPVARFEREERASLRPLPVRALPAREQRVTRRVAHDAMVDLHTVRYSVPHQLVRDWVEVVVDIDTVRIFHGARLVATHARSSEPFARVIDPAHYAGLWRPTMTPVTDAAPLAALGRALADYAAVIAGGAQ